ncbi:MAG: YggS family pyridoxal phosphate-dependent enzyme [Candidatus Omnitrophica bacterium]|nr:YggS family pyridoxal phosphate-dependent enzyme [Candidatus Omnitrophota bacterium]
MIKDNLNVVLSNINAACLRCGRKPSDVTLVGVTKFAEVPAINEAISAGLSHIAENKVQSAQEKFPRLDLKGASITRHLIGHLQTNKVKDALEIFDLIHSVDSFKLALEIQKRAVLRNKVCEILVQVDIAREEQKFGLPEGELDALVAHLSECSYVRTLGLMCMAPLTEDKALIRSVFHRLNDHFKRLQKAWSGSERIAMKHLSMGMSHDYEIAVEEGATMVRVGTAIFK